MYDRLEDLLHPVNNNRVTVLVVFIKYNDAYQSLLNPCNLSTLIPTSCIFIYPYRLLTTRNKATCVFRVTFFRKKFSDVIVRQRPLYTKKIN